MIAIFARLRFFAMFQFSLWARLPRAAAKKGS
jgi:hypothetical protein